MATISFRTVGATIFSSAAMEMMFSLVVKVVTYSLVVAATISFGGGVRSSLEPRYRMGMILYLAALAVTPL